jgi:SAM-dependent methyltransferase
LISFFQDKENSEHYVLKLANDSNYLSPLKDQLEKGIRVLDVGCSSGQWLLDMASEYPKSVFVGVDKALVFPKEYPKNVEFIQHDMLQGLPFKDGTFDFIFQRKMLMSYFANEWDFVIAEEKRLLRPGGYMEFSESTTDIYRPGAVAAKLFEGMNKIILNAGYDRMIGPELPDHLMSAGLTSIHSKCISIPLGWSGPVGELFKEDIRLAFEAKSGYLATTMNWPIEEVEKMVRRAPREWSRNRSWMNWYIVFAKKKK